MSKSDSDDDILISQADIDKLLNASSFDGEESLFDAEEDVSEDEMGALSQDDIDNLLNAPSEAFDSSGDDGVSDLDDDDDDLELVSQEDIDRLMNAATADGAVGLAPVEDEETMAEALVEVNPGMAGEISLDGESVIDESQAVPIAENLITQETIDRLMADGAEPASESGPDLASEPESDLEIEPLPEPEPELDPAPEPLPGDDAIAQADIDELLKDDLPEEGSDENDLISQDDIDELLRNSEEEDEDIIGDFDTPPTGNLDPDIDADQDIDPDGELSLEEDHQVVLEELKEAVTPTVEVPPDNPVPALRWYRSKKFMVACLAVCLVMAALPMAYFRFFGEKEPKVFPVPRQVADSPKTVVPEVVRVQVEPPRENEALPGPGNIVLENFVVLVPAGKVGFVYVTAGVSIDYSDARAAIEINSHLALYRDIIFEAMGRALASEKIDKITEVDLLARIKEALNRSLPGRYVEQVQFKAFSTG